MKISYFLKLNEAGYGGHGDGVVHLGNSHTNWCFRLHVYPECGIQSLRDMMRYLKDKLGQFQDPDQEYPRIENQYGQPISFSEFLTVVTRRSNDDVIRFGWDKALAGRYSGYLNESDFHAKNSSERGPNGLLRLKIDGVYCLGHELETCDLVASEFNMHSTLGLELHLAPRNRPK